MRNNSIFTAVWIVLLFNYIAGQNIKADASFGDKRIVQGQIGKKVDDYLNRSVPFGFSGALLIAQNDKILLLKGYGLSDRSRHLPVETDTAFYIGSLTKQFTAAAILKLEMQGKLHVTDTLDKFFNDVPDDKKAITVHQLLTHSSGLGDSENKYGSPIGKDEQLSRIMKAKLLFEPGKRYTYSNAGYTLLAIIVENASGLPYEQYLHEHIFAPAKMFSTGYQISKFNKEKVMHGYSGETDRGSPLDRPRLADGPSWAMRGAGGMLSTLGDLYRWHLALNKTDVLSAEAKQKIFAPQIEGGSDYFYGYGWTIQKTPRNTALIEHNGSDGIFFADFRRYTDENTVVIGATNDLYGVTFIQDKVPDIVFGGAGLQFPPRADAKEISPAILQKYAGTYSLPSGAVFNVTIRSNRLIFDPVGQGAINLLTNIEPSQRADYERTSVKVKEILDGAVKGDFTVLKENIAPEKFAGYKSFLLETLELPADNSSSAIKVKYTVVGTHPLWFVGSRRLATFIRVTDSKGATRMVFITWENGRIRGNGDFEESDDVSFRTPFITLSRTKFAGFHVGLEKNAAANFKTDQKGEPTAIEFQTEQGIKIAQRLGNNIR